MSTRTTAMATAVFSLFFLASEAVANPVHTVRSGDTLSEIAERYRTTVRAIKAANNLQSNRIRIGQRLRIPSSGTTVSASASHSGSSSNNGIPRIHQPMNVPNSHVEVLARIVKGECPPHMEWRGKVAVAAVVLNRVRSGRFPNNVPAVAHQPYQFSCYNRNVRRRLYYGAVPDWAYRAARAALQGYDPTQGATFYYNPYLVRPSWARSMVRVCRIGRDRSDTHDFYKPR